MGDGDSGNFDLFPDPKVYFDRFQEARRTFEAKVSLQQTKRKLIADEHKQTLDRLEEEFMTELATTQAELDELTPIRPSDVSGLPLARAAYSDRVCALMAKLSLLAYVRFEDSEKKKVLDNALTQANLKLLKTYAFDDTEAFLAEGPGYLVVAFRGSTSRVDVRTDMTVNKERVEVAGHDGRVKVHRGIYEAFQRIGPALHQDLVIADPGKPIFLTGHSLGGALALVGAAAFSGGDTLGERIAAVYSFGAPRVGGKDFPVVVKAPHYRMVNAGDIVPMLPPNWLSGYRHTGEPRILREGADRPLQKRAAGSILLLLIWSFLAWPFQRTFLATRAHDISVYAARCEFMARKRGRWT